MAPSLGSRLLKADKHLCQSLKTNLNVSMPAWSRCEVAFRRRLGSRTSRAQQAVVLHLHKLSHFIACFAAHAPRIRCHGMPRRDQIIPARNCAQQYLDMYSWRI
jgi:hypothetical protein